MTLRLLQSSLDVRDSNVEDGVALIARSAPYATPDACPILRRNEVQKPVAPWF
jgi:hypothetical protein